MKIKKKAAVAAMLFSAALNTACGVYGPPAEEWEPEETAAETVNNEDTTPSEEETDTDNPETSEGDEQQ